jgi:hypothetical protein
LQYEWIQRNNITHIISLVKGLQIPPLSSLDKVTFV